MNTSTATSPTAVALDPADRVTFDGQTVVDHSDHISTERAALTIQTMHDGHDYEQHIIAVVDDEPMTARQAREVAAALLTAADQIDGRESSVLSMATTTTPSTTRPTAAWPTPLTVDLDPGHPIDADTIRHRADRLSPAALVAITADVGLTAPVTVYHLERAGVTGRDLETLLAAE